MHENLKFATTFFKIKNKRNNKQDLKNAKKRKDVINKNDNYKL